MLGEIVWTGTGGVFENLTDDLVLIIPVALGIMASLWGVRLAISYFKGIAR